MRHIDGLPGFNFGGHIINNLRYSDDSVLIAPNEGDLQELLNVIVGKSEIMGLSLNRKKRETMVIPKKSNAPKCSIRIGNTTLNQVNKFKYLGTIITQTEDATLKSKAE